MNIDPISAFQGGFEKHIHPVWILTGDIHECEKVAESMIKSVMSKLHSNDIRKFDLNHSTVNSFHDFLCICPNYTKITTCVIRENDDHLFAKILKRIEDIPKATIVILIGQQLPPVVLTRGIVFYINSILPEDDLICILNKFPDNSIFEKIESHENPVPYVQKWLENHLLHALLKGDKLVLDMLYETWYKILEIMYWINAGEINKKDSNEMVNSILHTIAGKVI